jgi:LacI family transcriptional regulator
VGLGTASRALNGDFNIRAETLQKVKTAAAELGYALPHLERRPLSQGEGHIRRKILKHGRMAFFIPDRSTDGLDTLLSRKLIEGVESYLFDRKISLVTASFDADGGLPKCMKNREVDGIIVRGDLDAPNISDATRNEIKRFPLVSAMWTGRENLMDAVQPDSEQAGRMAARILVQRGRKHLACFNRWHSRPDLARTVFGFMHEAEALGVPVATYLSNPEDVAQQQQQLEAFWSSQPRSDGVLLVSGLEKLIPWFRSRRFGCGANRDVLGVLSCADSLRDYPELQDLYISQHAEQVGCAAAEQLLWRIEHPQSALQKILIAPDLVVGGDRE